MDIIKAVLYELQPFRIEDVRALYRWTRQSVIVLSQEFMTLTNAVHLITLPSSVCLLGLIWAVIYTICLYFQFGTLYFMLSLFVLIFFNLGDRKDGEMSAYSVFNHGYRTIMGTMTAEQFDKEIRHDNHFGEVPRDDNWEDDWDDTDNDQLNQTERNTKKAKHPNLRKKGKKNRRLLHDAKNARTDDDVHVHVN